MYKLALLTNGQNFNAENSSANFSTNQWSPKLNTEIADPDQEFIFDHRWESTNIDDFKYSLLNRTLFIRIPCSVVSK